MSSRGTPGWLWARALQSVGWRVMTEAVCAATRDVDLSPDEALAELAELTADLPPGIANEVHALVTAALRSAELLDGPGCRQLLTKADRLLSAIAGWTPPALRDGAALHADFPVPAGDPAVELDTDTPYRVLHAPIVWEPAAGRRVQLRAFDQLPPRRALVVFLDSQRPAVFDLSELALAPD